MGQPDFQKAVAIYDQLHSSFYNNTQPDLKRCGDLLEQLKVILAQLEILFLHRNTQINHQHLLLIRSALEIGALWSIECRDIPAFERHMAQLRTYFIDHTELEPSPRMHMLLGLDLLCLLSQNRISEFHAALELIPSQWRTDKYIAFACQLEQCLMEGSYHKVWNLRKDTPAKEYVFFLDILVGTIRDEIASCSEKSYESLPIKDGVTLLSLSSVDELMRFAKERNWTVNTMEERIYFTQHNKGTGSGIHLLRDDEEDENAVNVAKVIQQTLSYAMELEKIV